MLEGDCLGLRDDERLFPVVKDELGHAESVGETAPVVETETVADWKREAEDEPETDFEKK